MKKLDEIQIDFNNHCLRMKNEHVLEQKDITNRINNLKKYFKLNLLYIGMLTFFYPIMIANFGIVIPTIICGAIYCGLSYNCFDLFKTVRDLKKENKLYDLNFNEELNSLQNEFNNKINEKKHIVINSYNYPVNKKLVLRKVPKNFK